MFESDRGGGASVITSERRASAVDNGPPALLIPMSSLSSVASLSASAVQAVTDLVERLGGEQAASPVPEPLQAADLINLIRSMEELKGAAAAVQAVAAVRFDEMQRREQAEAGVRPQDLGRGVGAQIALARRESPLRGGRYLGLGKALLHELPCTFRALRQGKLSEWRATLVARETACLDPEDRAALDAAVLGDPEEAEKLGDKALVERLRRGTYRIDPAAVVRRARKAENERYVSCRPAPDTMTWVTGLLPVAQGVAVYAALSREADRMRCMGDPRGRGQIMADTLVERVTGTPAASGPRIEVQLILTDRTLLRGAKEPAVLAGYGTVPAGWARDLVRSAPEATLRRLYTAPASGELIAMDSRARIFPQGLARFITTRDQRCRTPWCGAPVRHIDHVQGHAAGGGTSAGNGQGLCENCNYTKQAPGWSSHPVAAPPDTWSMPVIGARPRQADGGPPGERVGVGGSQGSEQDIELRTPTGHRYVSAPPMLPGNPDALAQVHSPG